MPAFYVLALKEMRIFLSKFKYEPICDSAAATRVYASNKCELRV